MRHKIKINKNWPYDLRREIMGLIESYEDLYLENLNEFTVTNEINCQIRTFNNNPIFNKSNLQAGQNQLVEQRVNELLSTGHLEDCDSPYSSEVYPIFINNQLDLKIDYGPLNSITKNFNYHQPIVKDVINQINESCLFTQINLLDGFKQLGLSEGSKWKTAFATDFGHFQFKALHPGLKNNHNFLQKAVESSLRSLDKNFIRIYLGHILIHTDDDFNFHLTIVDDVLQCLRKSNFKVDINQTVFLSNEISYIGYLISHDGLAIAPEKREHVQNLNTLRNQTDVRSFLGLIQHYKEYLENSNTIAKILFKLTNPNSNFNWLEKHKEAFDILKSQFISSAFIPFGGLDYRRN